jgi:hypothetical protein
MAPKAWEPKRGKCKHCGGEIYQTSGPNIDCWIHLDHGSMYCEVKAPRAEPYTSPASTPNGFDPGWVECVNIALEGRESKVRVTDLEPEWWDEFIGPMVDRIEDGRRE